MSLYLTLSNSNTRSSHGTGTWLCPTICVDNVRRSFKDVKEGCSLEKCDEPVREKILDFSVKDTAC